MFDSQQACSDNPQSDHTEISSSAEALSSGSPNIGSFEKLGERRLSLSIPQTLQQEFALINVNIPNVTVEQVLKMGICLVVDACRFIQDRRRISLAVEYNHFYIWTVRSIGSLLRIRRGFRHATFD